MPLLRVMFAKTQSEKYAQVIIDIVSDNTDRLFSYRIPEDLRSTLLPGYRVLVPFGFREAEGFVVALSDKTDVPDGKLKDIIALLDHYPAISEELINLAVSLKEEFNCTLCEALRLMIPAQMRKSRIQVKRETYLSLSEDAGQHLEELLIKHKKASKRQLILQALSDGCEHPLKDLKAMIRAIDDPLRVLISEGSVKSTQKEVFRRPDFSHVPTMENFTLNDEQQEAFDEVKSAVESGTSDVFLLHGITGSGKTEVYVHLVREVIRRRKKAIILVPEISLTPQMIDYFYSRFGSRLAVLHSRLSAGERYDEWRRIRYGDADIVIGARSAVFAPVDALGIIIVDEEQESTYLSETHPQYDARQVAIRRASFFNCPTVLASATPSIYSYAQARRGTYVLLEMKQRANRLPLPDIRIADMREELRHGNRGIFSDMMKSELEKCFSQGEQAILFVNRRGYAPFVNCRSCGNTVKCAQCDVSMTYHKSDGLLHCHYCGSRIPLPEKCPSCGSGYMRPCGIGTQKVEEEFQRLYPGVKTLRMDQDTTVKKDALTTILNSFRARQAQVLIGTQMIAKGHDFPAVTFVGAVLADMTLNLPDYRSAERTYQLLVQVAGRAGRGEQRGSVVIQTYKPEHYAIQSAVDQDYRAFFNEEFSRRRRALYPPFTRLSRILVQGRDEEETLQSAKAFDRFIEDYLEVSPDVRRFIVFHRADMAPISRIQNLYRAQVLLKAVENPKASGIYRMIKETVERFNSENKFSKAEFDMNLLSMA